MSNIQAVYGHSTWWMCRGLIYFVNISIWMYWMFGIQRKMIYIIIQAETEDSAMSVIYQIAT